MTYEQEAQFREALSDCRSETVTRDCCLLARADHIIHALRHAMATTFWRADAMSKAILLDILDERQAVRYLAWAEENREAIMRLREAEVLARMEEGGGEDEEEDEEGVRRRTGGEEAMVTETEGQQGYGRDTVRAAQRLLRACYMPEEEESGGGEEARRKDTGGDEGIDVPQRREEGGVEGWLRPNDDVWLHRADALLQSMRIRG